MTAIRPPGVEGRQSTAASTVSKNSKNLGPPIWLAVVLWVVCMDWVFQWHLWLLPGIHYPWSDLGRFGILFTIAVFGWVPAALLHRGVRYVLLVFFTAVAPLLLVILGAGFLITFPVAVYKYPRRLINAIGTALRWISSSLVGKAVSLTVVVALTAVLPYQQGEGWIRVELAVLAVAMTLFMGGMLHLASSPLSYVDSWHRFLLRLMKWVVSIQRKLAGGEPNVDVLASVTGFAQAMTEELDEAKGAWRYFITFIGGLAVAFALVIFAFASAYAALDRIAPLGLHFLRDGYQAWIALSFGVITTTYVPLELLNPLSAYSVAVFAEVVLCFYLAAVTVWAFTAGAQRNTESMVEVLKDMWDRATHGNVEQLKGLDPSGSWQPKIQKAKDDWLKRLR